MSTRHPAMTPNHLHRDTGRKSERDRAVMRWRDRDTWVWLYRQQHPASRKDMTSPPWGPCTLIVSFRWTTAQLIVRAFQTLLRLFSSDELFTIYYKNINCIEDERKGNLSSQTDINCSRAWLFIRVQQLYNTWLIYIVPGVDIDIVTLSKYVSQCFVAVTIRI